MAETGVGGRAGNGSGEEECKRKIEKIAIRSQESGFRVRDEG